MAFNVDEGVAGAGGVGFGFSAAGFGALGFGRAATVGFVVGTVELRIRQKTIAAITTNTAAAAINIGPRRLFGGRGTTGGGALTGGISFLTSTCGTGGADNFGATGGATTGKLGGTPAVGAAPGVGRGGATGGGGGNTTVGGGPPIGELAPGGTAVAGFGLSLNLAGSGAPTVASANSGGTTGIEGGTEAAGSVGGIVGADRASTDGGRTTGCDGMTAGGGETGALVGGIVCGGCVGTPTSEAALDCGAIGCSALSRGFSRIREASGESEFCVVGVAGTVGGIVAAGSGAGAGAGVSDGCASDVLVSGGRSRGFRRKDGVGVGSSLMLRMKRVFPTSAKPKRS